MREWFQHAVLLTLSVFAKIDVFCTVMLIPGSGLAIVPLYFESSIRAKAFRLGGNLVTCVHAVSGAGACPDEASSGISEGAVCSV